MRTGAGIGSGLMEWKWTMMYRAMAIAINTEFRQNDLEIRGRWWSIDPVIKSWRVLMRRR